ncbi:hypothetical protein GIB67_038889, partial [Kingdonia uniflora]
MKERGSIEFDGGNSSMIQHNESTEREAHWVIGAVSEEGNVVLGSSQTKSHNE